MKSKTFICIIPLIGSILATSCAHNALVSGVGTWFKAGTMDANVMYADGLVGVAAARENVSIAYDIDSTLGFTYEPSTNTYKGIKSMKVEIGPQANGYVEKMDKESLDKYYRAVTAFYQAKYSPESLEVKKKEADVSAEKSTKAGDFVKEAVVKALEKYVGTKKEIVGDDGKATGGFKCDGNCAFSDLGGNGSVVYQRSIVDVLLKLDGSGKVGSLDLTFEGSLREFEHILNIYEKYGYSECKVRIDQVTAVEGRLTKLVYLFVDDDGTSYTTECPNCTLWELSEMLEE